MFCEKVATSSVAHFNLPSARHWVSGHTGRRDLEGGKKSPGHGIGCGPVRNLGRLALTCSVAGPHPKALTPGAYSACGKMPLGLRASLRKEEALQLRPPSSPGPSVDVTPFCQTPKPVDRNVFSFLLLEQNRAKSPFHHNSRRKDKGKRKYLTSTPS